MTKKKILVLRFSSIGDIVVTTPIIRALKTQLDAEIHFLVKDKFKQTVITNPYIHKVYTFQKETSECITQLKDENYDLVVDLHKNLRTSKLKLQLGKPSYSYNKLNISKLLLTKFHINLIPRGIHLVDRYFESLSALGIVNDGQGLDYFISPEDDFFGREFQKNTGEYTVLVLGATHYTKRIPESLCEKIIANIVHPVVLLGGNDVTSVSEALIKKFSHLLNYTGKISLNQSSSVIKYAKNVICPDTGLMHIAAAFNKKIEMYWGSTDPILGMYPYMPQENPSEVKHHLVKNLHCRPCTKIGNSKCPKGHFKCMLEQTVSLSSLD
ncbi:MAG: glycosyltransferase family 9 protein [Saprospiraceae bacterium]